MLTSSRTTSSFLWIRTSSVSGQNFQISCRHRKEWERNSQGKKLIGEQGGGVRGVYPVWKKTLWPPSKIQNDPHPLRNGFWPPIRFWAGDVCFFREDIKNLPRKKKFSPPYAGTSSWPKRAKTAIKFLAWDPPDPLCFKFLWPPSSSKKIFWPPSSRNDDLAHLWEKG